MSIFKSCKKSWIFSRSRNDILCLVALGGVCLCSFICYSLPAPFFTKEAEKKGVSRTVIGLLYGMFELFIFLASPVFGKYLSKLGYKKVYVVGVLLSGANTMVLGTLNTIPDRDVFVICCFIVRLLEAIGAAACLTAAYSIASIVFSEHVPSVMGIIEMCNGLGLMIGPAIGSGLYQAGGYGLPFYITGLLLIACGITGVHTIPTIADDKGQTAVSYLVLLRNTTVMVTGISVLVAACGIGFLEPTLAGQFSELNISNAMIGVFFVVLPLVYAISSPFVGFIVERKNCGKIMMTVALMGAFVSFVMIGPTPVITNLESSVIQLVVSSLCFGLTMSCTIVPSLPQILETVIREERLEDNLETYGVVSGFISACFSLGAFLGPIIGGVMVDHLQFPLATSCYAFSFCLMSIIGSINIIAGNFKKKNQLHVLENIELSTIDCNENINEENSELL